MALDDEGDIWVADAANNRVEEFSNTGEYLRQFGGLGEGNGQFLEPEGIAIDARGNIWVSDTYQGRVQEFTASGEFIRVVGSYGTGPGQIGEPTGIDVDPGGNLWIADWQDNRVEEFNEEGGFLRQFGSPGSGNGQFEHPDGIAVDREGNVWVADEGNDRVQLFDRKGDYRTHFGSYGSGDGQFDFGYPIGLAIDPHGHLWVADSGNDRVQNWNAFSYVLHDGGATYENGPTVRVNSAAGLVESVETEESGQHTYTHDGDLLTEAAGPQGETSYQYDGTGDLTKVTLPNGTWGEIAYEAAQRVKSVTVSIEGGAPTTTYFGYSDEPRRTTVTPEDAPVITYDIGSDGSVLKWWNSASPPEFDDLAGNLYVDRETAEPISRGAYNLIVKAHSEEGVASVQVIANNSDVVHETNCEQDYEKEGIECKPVESAWVTETASWSPGIVYIEVLITDRLGHTASERFWVNIPYTPPPTPEEEELPTFNEILHFREEFGLDLDLKGNEDAVDERIFNLIGDWYNPQTPEGEIARASAERWGVPMRPVDVAEMEYREAYLSRDIPLIEEWAEANAAGTYGGYYVDHAAGGRLYVGFTENAEAELASLKAQVPLMAAGEVAAETVSANGSLASVEQTREEILTEWEDSPGLEASITYVEAVSQGEVVVGASNVGTVESDLASLPSPHAAIRIVYAPDAVQLDDSDRIKAGESIEGEYEGQCTAGFGASEEISKKATGEVVNALFLLTAGHCYETIGEYVNKSPRPRGTSYEEFVGEVTRTGLPGHQHYETDALAIRLQGWKPPHYIYRYSRSPLAVSSAGYGHPGDVLCYSGITSGIVKCASEIGVRAQPEPLDQHGRVLAVRFRHASKPGDSGAPVWDATTGKMIGLILGHETGHNIADVTPLIQPRGFPVEKAPGVLNAPGMGHLRLTEAP